MKKGFIHLGGLILTILLIISANITLAYSDDEILLKSRHFVPERGITAAAKAKIEAVPGRTHILIQLERIPTIEERNRLETKGVKLLSYIPNNAWFASIPSYKAGETASLPDVRAISEILPKNACF